LSLSFKLQKLEETTNAVDLELPKLLASAADVLPLSLGPVSAPMFHLNPAL
jgi:hypothetical protein